MAKAEASAQGAENGAAAGAGGGVRLLPMAITVFMAVMLAAAALGGAGWWLVKSGRLALGGGGGKAELAKPLPPVTREVTMEPLLVNLADPSGRCYLRLTMTLAVEEPPAGKDEKPKEEKPDKNKPVLPEHNAEIRDAALAVIGTETADSLLAPDGKQQLKEQLRTAIGKAVPGMTLADVYFTEFLVQR